MEWRKIKCVKSVWKLPFRGFESDELNLAKLLTAKFPDSKFRSGRIGLGLFLPIFTSKTLLKCLPDE